MHLSEGGGFEIPILEALSCGVPVIGSDFIGMSELVDGHGWSIPMKTKYFSALDALQGIADEYKAAEALEDAYNHPEKREKLGKAGRKFALDFDFKHVNEKWIEFFEDIRDEWSYTPLETRLL
jgi:glycosyltransferase involved in cell wall biosynthesis